MASNSPDSMSCMVCTMHFDNGLNQPTFFPCQHTICANCVMTLKNESGRLNCPFCRQECALSDIKINMVVRDFALELFSKARHVCEMHGGKICRMACRDCIVPLCFQCIKTLREGPHCKHEIDDLEDVVASVKANIVAVTKEIIAEVPPIAAQVRKVVDKRLQGCIKDVTGIVNVVNGEVLRWHEKHMVSAQKQVREAMDKQITVCNTIKAALRQTKNTVDFYKVVEARKVIDAVDPAALVHSPHLKLQKDDAKAIIDQLCTLCETFELSSESQSTNKLTLCPAPSVGAVRARAAGAVQFARNRIPWRIVHYPCDCSYSDYHCFAGRTDDFVFIINLRHPRDTDVAMSCADPHAGPVLHACSDGQDITHLPQYEESVKKVRERWIGFGQKEILLYSP
jgi:hypothetical protein